jgi:hypothetical protein
MSLKIIVSEAVTDIVYHFLDYGTAFKSVEENKLFAEAGAGIEQDDKYNKGRFFFFSMTRSRSSGYKLGTAKFVLDGRKLSHNHKNVKVDYWQATKPSDSYFPLENKKLVASNFIDDKGIEDKKIKKFIYQWIEGDKRRASIIYGGLDADEKSLADEFKAKFEYWVRRAYKTYTQDLAKLEQEDRIILDKPFIENGNKYIKEIHIKPKKNYMHFPSLINFMDSCKRYGIKAYFYDADDEKSFLHHLTKNSVNPVDYYSPLNIGTSHKELDSITTHSVIDLASLWACGEEDRKIIVKEKLGLNEQEIDLFNEYIYYLENSVKMVRQYLSRYKTAISNIRSMESEQERFVLSVLAQDIKKISKADDAFLYKDEETIESLGGIKKVKGDNLLVYILYKFSS